MVDIDASLALTASASVLARYDNGDDDDDDDDDDP